MLQELIVLAMLFSAMPMVAQAPQKLDAYLDPNLPLAQRVDDLVGRMTLSENVSQMQNKAPSIPRLHIAEYDELYVGGGQASNETGVVLPFRIEGSEPLAP